MNRRALGTLAIAIIVLMGIVATAGLDDLPRDVRKAIPPAATQVNAASAKFLDDREIVTRAIENDPSLFRAKSAGYRAALGQDETCFANNHASLQELRKLEGANHRADADRVRSELAKIANAGCGRETSRAREEVAQWIGYKRDLPGRMERAKSARGAIESFDVDAAVAPVRKAELDWPAKNADLDGRIAQLQALKSEAGRVAISGPPSDPASFDYAGFFASADRLDAISKQLPDSARSTNQLAEQLYTGWDKLLLDLDGSRQKVRYVRTHYKDSTLAGPEVTSEEKYEPARSKQEHEGMVIARKAPGKYDSEAANTPEPPAIGYVAPPGQSNHYGSWSNGVWNWLPQYLIMRELLNAGRGPITYGDYNGWDTARRRGEIYYPRGTVRTAPGTLADRARDWAKSRSSSSSSSGSSGYYRERPKTYGSSGYGGSAYQNRGSYSGSKYQSRGGGYGSFGSRSYSRSMGGRSFGRGGRR